MCVFSLSKSVNSAAMPIQTSFDPAAMKTKSMHFLTLELVLRAEALNLHYMLYIKMVRNIVFFKKTAEIPHLWERPSEETCLGV